MDSLRRAGAGAEELRLVGALMRFWYVRGHLREGSSRCEDALAAHGDQSQPRLKALFGAGLLAHRLGDYQRAEALMQERLVLARVLDDPEAVASSLIGLGMNAQGSAITSEQQRRTWRAQSLPEPAATPGFSQSPSATWGISHWSRATTRRRELLLEESLGLFRQLGDERKIAERVVELGIVASREGRSDEAETLLRESLEYAEALVDKELAIWCLGELAALDMSKGDAERAARLMGAIERLREETGHASNPDERRLGEQTRSALASALGEEQLGAALAIGRAMTFEQAIAYALQT